MRGGKGIEDQSFGDVRRNDDYIMVLYIVVREKVVYGVRKGSNISKLLNLS